MNTLYDLGYQTLKEPDLLAQAAEKLDAIVLDIRLNPQSRDFRWNKTALLRKLIERYVHVSDLGNVNYKDWNAPIQIKDLEAGFLHLEHYLSLGHVILLCACRTRRTCHRLMVVEAAITRLNAHSVPLDLAACQKIIDPGHNPAQLTMF